MKVFLTPVTGQALVTVLRILSHREALVPAVHSLKQSNYPHDLGNVSPGDLDGLARGTWVLKPRRTMTIQHSL